MAVRQIAHVDLDAFYASVECLVDPSLRGKPLIVGGNPRERGVVAAASYEARLKGVRSAMPVSQAVRLCPDLIRVPPRHELYRQHSSRVLALLAEYTPVVEQISIDEAFLDLTGMEALRGPAPAIAEAIQKRVWDELGLPCSLGVATNKLVAKMACASGKPRGLVIVAPGQEASFLSPMPVEALWGVGEATGQRLRAVGIDTVGQLAAWPDEALLRLLGESGPQLGRSARGQDDSPVTSEHERRSYSQERTFTRDVSDQGRVRLTILSMAEHLSEQLRRDGLMARVVRIKLRYQDFGTVTRQASLDEPTDVTVTVYETAMQLLTRHWTRAPLRLVGLALSGLVERTGVQLSLFGAGHERQTRLDQAMDHIRERYGHDAISRASLRRVRRDSTTEDEPDDTL